MAENKIKSSHLQLAVNLGAPPVPDVHLPLPVPGGKELAVRAEGHPAGVPRVHVALELLLLHLSELVAGRPGDDLVVQRLADEEAPRWVQRRRRHRVHVRLRYVLDGHGNVVLPNQYLVGVGGWGLGGRGEGRCGWGLDVLRYGMYRSVARKK